MNTVKTSVSVPEDKLFDYGVVDPAGCIIHSTDEIIGRAISPDVLAGCMLSRRIAIDAFGGFDQIGSISIVYLPIELVSEPRLLGQLRPFRPPSGSVLVACLVPLPRRAEIFAAFEAFGLTGLESRVMVALMLTGTLPLAAERAGVTYNTARGCVNSVLQRTGHYRQAALVSLFLTLHLEDQIGRAHV